MKNIKAYTYWNVGMHLAPISIFIILLSIYFKQWSFMLLYGITLFMTSSAWEEIANAFYVDPDDLKDNIDLHAFLIDGIRE